MPEDTEHEQELERILSEVVACEPDADESNDALEEVHLRPTFHWNAC